MRDGKVQEASGMLLELSLGNKHISGRYWGKYGEKRHPGALQKDLNTDESSRASNLPGISLHRSLQESLIKVTCSQTKPFLNLTTQKNSAQTMAPPGRKALGRAAPPCPLRPFHLLIFLHIHSKTLSTAVNNLKSKNTRISSSRNTSPVPEKPRALLEVHNRLGSG